MVFRCAVGSILCLALYGATVRPGAADAFSEPGTEEALKGFSELRPIDVHAHVFKYNRALEAFLDRLHLTLLTILVVDDTAAYARKLDPQHTDALGAARASAGRVAFCTSFDPYRITEPDFAKETVQQLDADFARGAVAVKLWKNVGMQIRGRDGRFVMPDDPLFEPLYKDIAQHRRTLITHLAEPDACWEPPDSDNHSYQGILRRYVDAYYTQNPQWYMYRHPDRPTKQAILAARDHLIERNPQLRVVGAHLGSMENDVGDIAQRLDRYPNFAVETGGRTFYWMMQPRDKVRAFILNYQDRILYGTDFQFSVAADAAAILRRIETTYAQDWKFFATGETFQVEGQPVHGLNLPQEVLAKIFRQNAMSWIPGIVANRQINPAHVSPSPGE